MEPYKGRFIWQLTVRLMELKERLKGRQRRCEVNILDVNTLKLGNCHKDTWVNISRIEFMVKLGDGQRTNFDRREIPISIH